MSQRIHVGLTSDLALSNPSTFWPASANTLQTYCNHSANPSTIWKWKNIDTKILLRSCAQNVTTCMPHGGPIDGKILLANYPSRIDLLHRTRHSARFVISRSCICHWSMLLTTRRRQFPVGHSRPPIPPCLVWLMFSYSSDHSLRRKQSH